MTDEKPILCTVAFQSPTRGDFDAFWSEMLSKYKFCEPHPGGTNAFAVSMEDMFAKEAAIEAVLNSDLDCYQKVECIGEFYSHPWESVLRDWEIAA